jgi:hypothetical protein
MAQAPKSFPRGIAPDLLLAQVRNTMPYLFEPEAAAPGLLLLLGFPGARIAREAAAALADAPALSHLEYFKLCLASHYLTCGTPVPTDVDNQIRQKLWPEGLPLETALEMSALVLESRSWDFTRVTSRFVHGTADWKDEVLSGHLGEWFTVSAGAYCALERYSEPEARARRSELLDAISSEVDRHSEIFGALWRAREGLACLKASSSIAHNFGDLDRVMDMWELDVGDPLRLRFYKLSATPFDAERKLRYLGRLWVAGELYKSPIDGSSMALENHRHYALRKPRPLRSKRDLVVPTAPFFDDWGARVGSLLAGPSGELTSEVREVAAALKQGWDRQPRTVAYGRGLRGILSVHPSIAAELEGLRAEHAHRAVLDTPKEPFERRWAEEALKQMDEIPSRA